MGTSLRRDIYHQVTVESEKNNTILLTRVAIAMAIFFGLCASTFLQMYALGL